MKRLGRNDDEGRRIAPVLRAQLRSAAVRAIRVAACGLGCFAAGCGSQARAPDGPSAPLQPSATVMRAFPPPPVARPSVKDAGADGPELPKILSIDGFGEGERIADLTGTVAGERILLAWVTYFDEGAAVLRAPKKAARSSPKTPAGASESAKGGASVVVRALAKDGDAMGPPKPISFKAMSIGGIAIGRGPSGDIALAWVGKDAGLGQVFVTKLSDSGDKLAQRMITHSKSGCSDVAIAAVPEGFVVAWAESRDTRTEIVAAKLGKDLARVGSERRIAEAKGEASEIRVLARSDDLLFIWSEARAEGEGGIASARLLAADLSPRGDPTLVVPVPGHARGLDVARAGDGLQLAWVEEATRRPADAGALGRALSLTRLDASGLRPAGRTSLPVTADPSSVAMDCSATCRVVVPVAEAGELALYGFTYDGSERPLAVRRLGSFSGVSTEDTSPVLLNDWLFFAEDDLRGGGRIRRVKLAW